MKTCFTRQWVCSLQKGDHFFWKLKHSPRWIVLWPGEEVLHRGKLPLWSCVWFWMMPDDVLWDLGSKKVDQSFNFISDGKKKKKVSVNGYAMPCFTGSSSSSLRTSPFSLPSNPHSLSFPWQGWGTFTSTWHSNQSLAWADSGALQYMHSLATSHLSCFCSAAHLSPSLGESFQCKTLAAASLITFTGFSKVAFVSSAYMGQSCSHLALAE